MKELLHKKLVLPVLALAIVGVVGTVYTVTTTGPTTAHAQTPTVKSAPQEVQDGETQDDVVSTSQTGQQKADTNENDKADNGSTPEVEDGK